MTLTYAQLKTAVTDFVEYPEETFETQLPLFIRLAEERILKGAQLNIFRKNATAVTTTGNKYLPTPGDFLAPFSLSYFAGSGDQVVLQFKEVSFLQNYWPDPTVQGAPVYYAQFDVDTFMLAPTPDAAYAVELHYLYRPASITAGAESGTTWLSKNAEVALLYGAVLEAYIFMKGEADLLQMYSARFEQALVDLKNHGEFKEVTDQFRHGQKIQGGSR